ncbi:hypothetical protein BDF14DRAFT_1801301 [Spinellus fusiger]|nr:hypothetical protein BDF14DRAFT_1801181 [Spinellus fusiger]KAI7867733.1 hypothetical protein BDF14DRAFT_1801301 [Spinellus fusiger]
MDDPSPSNSFSKTDTMSATGSMTSGDHIISVKYSIDGIGWHGKYRDTLEQLVITVNAITKYSYSFSKFVFLCEL